MGTGFLARSKERMRTEIALLVRSFTDFIFPPFCPLCEQELTHHEHLVCEECFETIQTIEGRFCRRCGAPAEERRKTCIYCRGKEHHLSKVRAFGVYAPPLSEMVHLLKYERKTHLSDRLGIFMANLYCADPELCSSSAIIPVPLHPVRMRERGYNQSFLLARKVAAVSHTALLADAVVRKKATRSQTALKHDQRIANLKNAFHVQDTLRIEGKTVTVIDDVFTSGTTLGEMAKTLLDAGAERVFGLVLARALSR